jgi:putative phosphoesterase
MKIGVISDTHLTQPTAGVIHAVKHKLRNTHSLETLQVLVQHHFSGVDLIIHAGDFVDTAVFEMLREFAPVEAVQGNMDSMEIHTRFPVRKVVKIEGRLIGITHGEGGPQGILKRVKRHFPEKVEVIIFGHTHQPLNDRQEGILFFNPGSPTDRIFAPYNSLGLLEVSSTDIHGSIIRV